MLKKSITYEDFNGREVTDEFHFHLSKAELVEMEAGQRGGLGAYLQHIVETNDGAAIISAFKTLIQKSIGQVSEDGKRFEKGEEITRRFTESPAYSELFMQLATNANASAEFVNGIIPKGLEKDVAAIGETASEPQREREQAERLERLRDIQARNDTKVMTKAEAEELNRNELMQRMKDGWVIES